jgi:hypothetical protein
MMKLHSVVRLKTDLPKEHLKSGSIGTIVAVFDRPELAYEVEFADERGATVAELALRPDQIEEVQDSPK